ncbi:MAG: radical SAM protein [Nitrospirae bacterium]|nr:radical SAM protein [Nitrospirota bacterium]
MRRSPVPSPRYLELLITDRCNLKCRHCYIGEPRGEDLPLDRMIRVLEEFEALQGLRILISGGEPLMHGEFEAVNDYLSDYPLRRVLFSNGLLLKEGTLRGLNVDEIQISIDGLRDAHDALRGRGGFDRAMAAVRAALECGFDVSVSTMIHPGNLDDFDRMEELFRELGVKSWAVDVPCPSGRMRLNTELCLRPEVAGGYLAYGYGEGLHGGGEGFACGLHLVSVLPGGDVAKCAFYADRALGHVSEGLETCWRRLRPLRLADIECSCDVLDACRGGCRYRAELFGNPLGRDPYRCAFFGLDAGV